MKEVSYIISVPDSKLSWLAWARAILLVRIIGMELNISQLPDNVVHVSRSGRWDTGVTELDAVAPF
jgi:hypothetical protein